MDGLVISDALKDLIINIINIIVLFLIVRTLAYKPVRKFLNDRKERIANELNEAKLARETAESDIEKYNSLLKESEKKCTSMINEAEHTAKENAAEIIATAKEKAAEITEKARVNAKNEHDTQIAAIKDDVTAIAFDIANQILSREVTDEDNKRIADSFFADFKAD